jgi:phage baseplate assembly protein V
MRLETLRRILAPLSARISAMIGRAIVRTIDDSAKLQELQLQLGTRELVARGERFQEYGFTSVPLPGAEAVVVFPFGDRGHPLVVAVDDRSRRPLGLAPGEVMLYAEGGARVHLKNDGTVEITATEIVYTGATNVKLASGGSSIELTPAGVTIIGTAIDLNP